MTAADMSGLNLPQIFTPVQAAEILRELGLAEMTDTALLTRAYRRQVPFPLNGRRVRFTASDLREIVEAHSVRPQEPGDPSTRPGSPREQPADQRHACPAELAHADQASHRHQRRNLNDATPTQALAGGQPPGPHPLRLALRRHPLLDRLLRRPGTSQSRCDYSDHRATQRHLARPHRPEDAARRMDRRLGDHARRHRAHHEEQVQVLRRNPHSSRVPGPPTRLPHLRGNREVGAGHPYPDQRPRPPLRPLGRQ